MIGASSPSGPLRLMRVLPSLLVDVLASTFISSLTVSWFRRASSVLISPGMSSAAALVRVRRSGQAWEASSSFFTARSMRSSVRSECPLVRAAAMALRLFAGEVVLPNHTACRRSIELASVGSMPSDSSSYLLLPADCSSMSIPRVKLAMKSSYAPIAGELKLRSANAQQMNDNAC